MHRIVHSAKKKIMVPAYSLEDTSLLSVIRGWGFEYLWGMGVFIYEFLQSTIYNIYLHSQVHIPKEVEEVSMQLMPADGNSTRRQAVH